jgi:hypothetical protein
MRVLLSQTQIRAANNNNNKQKEKTCTLIDVAVPADRNFVQKEVEES